MLFRTIKNYKKIVVYIFFLVIVSFGINLIGPRIESKIVDSGILSKDIKSLGSVGSYTNECNTYIKSCTSGEY